MDTMRLVFEHALDLLLTLRQLSRVGERLDALRPVHVDETQFIVARFQFEHFDSYVLTVAFKPPEHDTAPCLFCRLGEPVALQLFSIRRST